jgi:YD repeat-containing protein
MEIHMEDNSRAHFDRISRGSGYADAVYEERAAASEFYKARLWWNGNGWTLKFADGRLVLFPESYYAKTMSQGAPVEIRDAAGRRIRLERDPDRNLRLLVSPHGHFIRFEYDDSRRITEATDDGGRTVRYEYDPSGRLKSVRGVDGQITRFTYNQDRMLTVQDDAGHILLQNWYDQGRVVGQRLSDGATYRYSYQFFQGAVIKTLVMGPGGARTIFALERGAWKQSPTLTASLR